MTATGCLLFVYVYERSVRLYGYFQRILNHPYWMAGASKSARRALNYSWLVLGHPSHGHHA